MFSGIIYKPTLRSSAANTCMSHSSGERRENSSSPYIHDPQASLNATAVDFRIREQAWFSCCGSLGGRRVDTCFSRGLG